MSNYLAVSTVSAALAEKLDDAIKSIPFTANAVVGQPAAPTATPAEPEIRVFLYSVQPNGFWRNNDLPTRNSGGQVMSRPQAALDLHYLLTFHGDESQLVPQQLLGIAVSELHASPQLSRELIRNVIAKNQGAPLALADLDEQPEMVRFSPLLLNLEELSKLWSVLFQIPYQLSVAYQASVVLISPDTAPRSSLPVSDRHLLVTSFRKPRIERIDTLDEPGQRIFMGTRLTIRGVQLRGDSTRVWFGGISVQPDPDAITDQEIQVDVPDEARAGLIGIRIEHRHLVGDPPTERPAGQSNVVPIMLRPHIRVDAQGYMVEATAITASDGLRSGNLVLTVDPAVGNRQRVILYLNQTGGSPTDEQRDYSFEDEPRNLPGAPDQTNALSIPFSDVATGSYLVRISVDGAESPLDRNTNPNSPAHQQYIAPQVDIP